MAKKAPQRTKKPRTTKSIPPKANTKSPSSPATPKKKQGSTNGKVPLMVTVSGIRGIVGDGFTAMSITPYIDAFAQMVKGKRVVLGHDARPSAKWILPLIEGILRSHGIDVAHVGMVPTPTVGLLTRKLKVAGGICVTASHNPIEYNGIKLFSAGGEFFSPSMIEDLKKIAASPLQEPGDAKVGKSAFLSDASVHHLNALLEVFPPQERVRASKRPKVIIDCCNSAGVEIAPDVADAYGSLFQMINSDSSADCFPRGAEPLAENIKDLCKAVIKEGADLGFAIDPDADRLALVDEFGRPIGEERTLLLAADAYLSMEKKKKSPLVVNLSSSQVMDDLAARHRVKIYRTKIGEANVLEGMRQHKAKIGGEGNGGVIVPAVQPGRDAATAIALILLGMSNNGKSLSQWNADFHSYVTLKAKVPLGKTSVNQALAKIKRAFKGFELNTEDGVKASQDERWIHVRPSNTEPIIRIYAEGPDQESAAELIEKAKSILS